jgi:membrane-associated phospholipid phosphatase
MRNNTQWLIAKIISTLGNPLVLGLLYTALIQHYLPVEHPILVYSLLITIVVIPVILYIFLNVKRGTFKNYDVSHQKKRNSLYKFALVLLFVLNLTLFFLDYSLKESLSVVIVFVHLFNSYLLNQVIKASMHTSFNFLFAFMISNFDFRIAAFLYLFGFLNAWSRLALSRHKSDEIVVGYLLGNCTGIVFLILTKKLL